jgi:sugar O-acyltransferase (sialic acid O-acetyltransferase NeuD family)
VKYAIYSCEGFSREILPLVKASWSLGSEETVGDQIVFVEDDPKKAGTVVSGIEVITFSELQGRNHRDRLISVGIADPQVRRKIVSKCAAEGFKFFSVHDEGFFSGDNVVIGEGSIFCAATRVTADAVIGRHFHCNIYSYVAHDCKIGDFVTFAPRVSCNGRVEIGDFAYIGTGAVLKQGVPDKPLKIGRGAIVGMGAVVLADVPDNAVVVGNPARIIKTLNTPASR